MDPILEFLRTNGPSRSSLVAEWLQSKHGLTAEAARKRISRIKPPLHTFPVSLLPKKETFLYHQDQRSEERFWTNLQRDMRSSGSVFAAALDGLAARGGALLEENFAAISGGTTTPQRGQLTAQSIAERLVAARCIENLYRDDGSRYINISQRELGHADWSGLKARSTAEKTTLDALREWARKIGLASYNTIAIRGEPSLKPIGGFKFDLAGPSYLLPLKSGGKQPGFLVADVFSEGPLNDHQIRYFLRKTAVIQSTLKQSGVLAILVAERFTGPALTAGHNAGVILATPSDLFGRQVGQAIHTLLETLKNAAAYAAKSPERLTKLIDDLSEIEGSAGNLRGVLFELVVAYLVRQSAVSIDMGVRAKHPDNGKTAEIDILKITSQSAECTAIECKGKSPGGVVTKDEAEDWIRRLPIFQAHLHNRPDFREATLKFELWTSGSFTPDAISYLEGEKKKRTKHPIDWKDGAQVLAIAQSGKEKAIADALRQHFIQHPLQIITKPIQIDLEPHQLSLPSPK